MTSFFTIAKKELFASVVGDLMGRMRLHHQFLKQIPIHNYLDSPKRLTLGQWDMKNS
jgi:hypothetical protein